MWCSSILNKSKLQFEGHDQLLVLLATEMYSLDSDNSQTHMI